MTATMSADEQEHALQSNVTYRFLIRAVVLAVVVGIFMSLGNVNIGAIGQGLGYALAGVCVFLTFRVLGFVDLTVDGAFPIGGAVCAVLIVSGVSAEFAIVAAFIAGALTGLATALIDIVFKIEGLLASIIVITGGLYGRLAYHAGQKQHTLARRRNTHQPTLKNIPRLAGGAIWR